MNRFDLVGSFQDDFRLVAVFGHGARDLHILPLEPLQVAELGQIAFKDDSGKRRIGSPPEVDEDLLRPNKNPLFQKLTFSKRKVNEGEWRTTDLREAHITILIDRFSTKVLTRHTQPPPGSFCLHNLLAEYRADFDVKGDSATWSRKVVPNQNAEMFSGDTCAQYLYQAIDGLTRLAACYYDWGNSIDRVPAIQLELSDTDKHLINHIHEHSDWVFTIDRNFGIEYFDNPRTGGGAVRS